MEGARWGYDLGGEAEGAGEGGVEGAVLSGDRKKAVRVEVGRIVGASGGFDESAIAFERRDPLLGLFQLLRLVRERLGQLHNLLGFR